MVDELLPQGPQVETTVSVAANLQHLADGSYALHLVNYAYDQTRVHPAMHDRHAQLRADSGNRRGQTLRAAGVREVIQAHPAIVATGLQRVWAGVTAAAPPPRCNDRATAPARRPLHLTSPRL